MIDLTAIAKILKTDNLEDFVVSKFLNGKMEVDTTNEDQVSNAIEEINKLEEVDIKVARCIRELSAIKNIKEELQLNNFVTQQTIAFNNFSITKDTNFIIKDDDVNGFARFILNQFKLNQFSKLSVLSKLSRVESDSKAHHDLFLTLSYANSIFEILNKSEILTNFVWNWQTFEKGVAEVLISILVKMSNFKIDCEFNAKHEIILKKSEIDSYKMKNEYLSKDVSVLEGKIEFYKNYLNYYYDENKILVAETYFGDNLPFLIKLFNFLKSKNLYKYSWSYFYSCMLISSNEIIFIDCEKKMNYIGRIFYRLSDFLTKKYRDNSFEFYQQKFQINEIPISVTFKTNHMKMKYDKLDHPELIEIDNFFDDLRKIYSK